MCPKPSTAAAAAAAVITKLPPSLPPSLDHAAPMLCICSIQIRKEGGRMPGIVSGRLPLLLAFLWPAPSSLATCAAG